MDQIGKIVEVLETKSDVKAFKANPNDPKAKAKLMGAVAGEVMKAFAGADPKDVEKIGK